MTSKKENMRMDWHKLISNKRFGQESKHAQRHDDRSEFKRDYDRLIFSAPFRRMQNKTQVFPLPGSIFVLTHSLEVASVGMSLGNDVAQEIIKRDPTLSGTLFEEIGTIVSTACLAHDMGNPPFGHSGEKAIQAFFTDGSGLCVKDIVSDGFWNDIIRFEGNANVFRLLTHRFRGRRVGGFVMTYSLLASVVKYPFSSRCAGAHGKFGFFCSEADAYCKVADELGIIRKSAPGEPIRYARHPLVYLVEAADDICYEIMDIEDAHKLKIITFDETRNLLLGFFDDEIKKYILKRIVDEELTDDNEKVVYMRARVIGKLVAECTRAFVEHEDEIMSGTFEGSLIDHIDPPVRDAYRACAKLSCEKIYNSKPVLDVELSGYKIIETLMETLIEAALSPEKYHSGQLRKRFSSQYDINSDDIETRIMAVIDFVSGMTDVFALDIYQKINGTSLPIV